MAEGVACRCPCVVTQERCEQLGSVSVRLLVWNRDVRSDRKLIDSRDEHRKDT